MGELYRWLWTHVGGRPWTYILRDYYHEAEFVVIMGTLALGYFAGHMGWLGTHDFALFGISVTLGYILGHLFWGTRWVPGEEGKTEDGGR